MVGHTNLVGLPHLVLLVMVLGVSVGDDREQDARRVGFDESGSGASAEPLRGADSSVADAPVLSEHQRALLDFEARSFSSPGAKAKEIRSQFGLSVTRYHQLLGELLDSPAALAADPLLVGRLLRMRDRRLTARKARRPISLD